MQPPPKRGKEIKNIKERTLFVIFNQSILNPQQRVRDGETNEMRDK